jgi:hypothetical protein
MKNTSHRSFSPKLSKRDHLFQFSDDNLERELPTIAGIN